MKNSNQEVEITATIEGWVPHIFNKTYFVILGNIVGDANRRWADGTFFNTSAILVAEHNPRELKEGDVVRTMNSNYKLGKPKHAIDAYAEKLDGMVAGKRRKGGKMHS